jgi:hypothetical protein
MGDWHLSKHLATESPWQQDAVTHPGGLRSRARTLIPQKCERILADLGLMGNDGTQDRGARQQPVIGILKAEVKSNAVVLK